tara:strand:- start:331 stop:537 length:207 start_codon:yes stop_codon:yes gene_type:complete
MNPLIAVRRLRSDDGGVVLPGCPIPGSDAWSEEVRAKRITQGFAKEGEKPKAKAKTKKKQAKKPVSKE